MKYLLLFLSVAFFSFSFKGDEIPEKVSNSFYESFASAENVEWHKIEHGAYEVKFEILKIDYKAQLGKSGKLMKYKHDIKRRSIPGVIATTVATNYPDYKIQKTEKLVIGSTTYYQVELKASDSLKIVFSPTGKELKKLTYWD